MRNKYADLAFIAKLLEEKAEADSRAVQAQGERLRNEALKTNKAFRESMEVDWSDATRHVSGMNDTWLAWLAWLADRQKALNIALAKNKALEAHREDQLRSKFSNRIAAEGLVELEDKALKAAAKKKSKRKMASVILMSEAKLR